MAFVYWIHLEEHTDMFTEGYIGITTMTVEQRFKTHLSAARNYRKGRTQRILHCLRKYESLVKVKTLIEGSLEYCQLMELQLRPEERIGWNLAVGGSCTRAGCKNTPEHNAKVAQANTGKKRSPEEIERNRQKGKTQMSFTHSWEHPYSNKIVWARANDIYDWYLLNPKDGRRTVGKALDMPPDSVLHPLKQIKDGWNPYEDSTWLYFKQSYEESQYEQTK